MDRSPREEELQIEVERLKAWLYKIQTEAFKETHVAVLEWLASEALIHSHCAAHPNWAPTEDWAPLGVWPPKTVKDALAESKPKSDDSSESQES